MASCPLPTISRLRALILAVGLGLLGTAAQAQVYGLKARGDGSGQFRNSVLFTVTPATPTPVTGTLNAVTTAPVTLGGSGVLADGLAINSRLELFAYVNSDLSFTPSGSTAQLVSLDKATGVATAIGGPLGNAWITGAAFDMNDRLWVLSWQSGPVQQLMQIDPATGSVVGSPVNLTGVNLVNAPAADIAFDLGNNAYLSTGNSIAPAPPSVYSLNVATGAATALHTFPTGLVSNSVGAVVNGMAFFRNEETWFAQSTGIDRVIYAPGIASLASAHNIVTDLTTDTGIANSGSVDLAARPNRVTADDDAATTPLDTPVTIAVLGNDKEFWSALGVNLSVDAAGTLPINTWPLTTANGGTVTPSGGGLLYTPASGFTGTDTFTYRAVATDGSWAEATVTVTVLARATLAAQPDSGTVGQAGGTAVANVRANDTFNGAPATSANTTVAAVGAWPAGITLNAAGGVDVAAGTAPGTYLMNYQLCDITVPANCVTTSVTVTVTAPPTPVPANAPWALLLAALGVGASVLRRKAKG